MLRIFPEWNACQSLVLRLEGKLLAPWIGELSRLLDEAGRTAKRVRLDLSQLTYADAAGEALLRDLVFRGVAICGCSPYIAALLATVPQSSSDEDQS